jgi:glycerol-3-phosphate dehydrogenase (NAD(P)+)
MPGLVLPDTVVVTSDLAAAAGEAEACLVVVPSVGVPWVAEALSQCVRPGTLVVSAAKGLEHGTGRRMTVVLADALGPTIPVAALSGPNLADEIAAGQPAAAVVAGVDADATHRLQAALGSPSFRVYTNTDVAGVELCGALKNPLAIAAGIVDGLGYGDNTKAALMTRGMHEICRLGVALGADRRTFSGLCGFGDLLATCHSRLSRNRTVGEKLGHGQKLADILAETSEVAEGVPTTRTACRLAQEHGVAMPILSELHAVLFEDRPVEVGVAALMTRADEFS